jgi:hypothetical protein
VKVRFCAEHTVKVDFGLPHIDPIDYSFSNERLDKRIVLPFAGAYLLKRTGFPYRGIRLPVSS